MYNVHIYTAYINYNRNLFVLIILNWNVRFGEFLEEKNRI